MTARTNQIAQAALAPPPSPAPIFPRDAGADQRLADIRAVHRHALLALAQHLLHRLALRELVDQFVEVADLAHQRVFDLLTRTPHTLPVISARAGFIAGASAKKAAKSVPCSSTASSPACE